MTETPSGPGGYRDLFATGTDPVTVVTWKPISQALEAAIDRCETSARLIERAITRQRR